MMVPVVVRMPGRNPQMWIWGVGHVVRLEEIELPGPEAMIPYIRVHLRDGSYCDIPKHQTAEVEYAEDRSR